MKIVFNLFACVWLAGCVSVYPHHASEPQPDKAPQSQFEQFDEKLLAYEAAVRHCDQVAKLAEKMALPVELIKRFDIKKPQAVHIAIYFVHTNYSHCLGDSRSKLLQAARHLGGRGVDKEKAKQALNYLEELTADTPAYVASKEWFDSLPQEQQRALNEALLGKLLSPLQISNWAEVRAIYSD